MERREIGNNVRVFPGTQGIQHALGTQKLSSSNDYVRDFKDKIVGKAPSDLENSYPEYDLARMVTKMASKVRCLVTLAS